MEKFDRIELSCCSLKLEGSWNRLLRRKSGQGQFDLHSWVCERGENFDSAPRGKCKDSFVAFNINATLWLALSVVRGSDNEKLINGLSKMLNIALRNRQDTPPMLAY
jgi:hypothetical protein